MRRGGEYARGNQRPCYPFKSTKKRRKNSFLYTRPKGFLKENSLLSDFSPNTIMNVPKLLPPPLPLRSVSQSNSLLSIGGILEAGAEC